MSNSDARAVHVRISGQVQGVGYRAWTVDEARHRGLSGWVRNLANGDVEAVFSGPAVIVDDMVASCRRGPTLARVATVDVADAALVSGRFAVRHDG
jgi:acylphosphatase